MPYTHTTFAQLKISLAGRLGDLTNAQWSDPELGLYCIEALRTWSLATGYWRDTGQINTVAGTGFYDISTLNNGTDDLLSYAATDKDVSTLVQYHLLEPATGSSWAGSEQFTLSDMVGALNRRRDAFLSETGSVITQSTQALPANSQFFDTSDNVIDIRNLRWTDSTGVDYVIYPEDISSQRNYSTTFLLTTDIPQTYSSSSVQQLRYVLAPPSNQPGTLGMLTINSGALLDASGISLGIPDDMASVIKWGVLADMLGKEGPGQDLPRSYYCERKWKLGLALSSINPIVINAAINGISMSPEAISRLDQYSPNWSSTQAPPTLVGSLRNIIALANCPDGVYSVVLDVARKAIIPSINSDFIQIGREFIDPLLDYSEHLASFKSGGMEMRHTYRGVENFFNAALAYNQKLAAQHPDIVELIKQSTVDDTVLPFKKQVNNQPLQVASQMSDQQ